MHIIVSTMNTMAKRTDTSTMMLDQPVGALPWDSHFQTTTAHETTASIEAINANTALKRSGFTDCWRIMPAAKKAADAPKGLPP